MYILKKKKKSFSKSHEILLFISYLHSPSLSFPLYCHFRLISPSDLYIPTRSHAETSADLNGCSAVL